MSPKDEVRKSAIEMRHEKTKTLTSEELRNIPDGCDEINDPLSSISGHTISEGYTCGRTEVLTRTKEFESPKIRIAQRNDYKRRKKCS